LEGSPGPILGYSIYKLICRDVTGDGRSEMVLLLQCCTANTPTPWAVFQRKARRWRPIFQVVSRKISVVDLRVNPAGDLVEKLPVYQQGDAMCCPSSYAYRTRHWNGTRFVTG
jgi:hypothetical protein